MLTTVTESASRLAPSHFVVIAACAETKSGRNVFGDRIRRAGTSGGRILDGRNTEIQLAGNQRSLKCSFSFGLSVTQTSRLRLLFGVLEYDREQRS